MKGKKLRIAVIVAAVVALLIMYFVLALISDPEVPR